MKRAVLLTMLALAACGPAPGPAPHAALPFGDLPSAQPASPDQAATARQAIAGALDQIRRGQGVRFTGDSLIDSGGTDTPAHLSGSVGPDGAMDLYVSVQFNQGTDVFEVRTVAGREYTWDPNSNSWSTATVGEPAAGGISTLDPLFMDYAAQISGDTLRVAPDDVVNGTGTSV